MTSTERSVMRLASSWMVITSGMITSRMTLSRGCTTPAWRSFSRSRRRFREASERSRCASSKALLMVSLMRSRFSSPTLTGLLGGLAPFFLAREFLLDLGLDLQSTPAALGDLLDALGRLVALGFSAGRALASTVALSAAGASGLSTTCGSAAAGAAGSSFAGSGSGFGRSASRRARSRSSISARSLAASSARRRASSSSVERPPGRSITSASSRSASVCGVAASSPSAPPGPEMVRFFFFSTTTDLERPWLKFCRTWPDSTVRFRLIGLRGAAPRNVFSVVSFVSVMHVLCLVDLRRHATARFLAQPVTPKAPCLFD